MSIGDSPNPTEITCVSCTPPKHRHIGQSLNGWNRDHEHRTFLNTLCDVIKAEYVDVLLVAGDVFDGIKGGLVATLFIDEGFGSLDTASLDLVIDALEGLQSQGRQVGVISRVEAMKDRIPTRIAVRQQGGGKSVVEINGLG